MNLVEGMKYLPHFITRQQETDLINDINSRNWNNTLKRRTQHYGYQYSYDKTNTLQKQQPIPVTFEPIKQQIEACLYETMGKVCSFDQLIVNQYQPGQGISPHIDNKTLFSDIIVSLSLGSNAVMVFEKQQQKHNLLLQRGSLLIISGEARQNWKHSIPGRKKDNGVARGVRLSMTWRKLHENYKKI